MISWAEKRLESHLAAFETYDRLFFFIFFYFSTHKVNKISWIIDPVVNCHRTT